MAVKLAFSMKRILRTYKIPAMKNGVAVLEKTKILKNKKSIVSLILKL